MKEKPFESKKIKHKIEEILKNRYNGGFDPIVIDEIIEIFEDETDENSEKSNPEPANSFDSEQQVLSIKKDDFFSELYKNHAAIKILLDASSGNIIVANNSAAEYYGYSTSELEKMNLSEICHYGKESVSHMLENFGKFSKLRYEAKHIRSDGTICEVEIYGSMLQLDGSNLIDFIIYDLTEKKESDTKLKLLSRSVEQSPVSILITDCEGKIEYANSAFASVTGYTLDEVLGKNPKILKSDEHPKDFYEKFWDTILSGKEWEGEFINKKKNGELYWEECTVAPIINIEGDITHFVAVKEDITEKKKRINELTMAKEKAEEMNLIKSYFFANMSHELRTPFVGIMGYGQLLHEAVEDSYEIELVEGIMSSSDRLMDTLTKILELTKLEFDDGQFQKSEFDAIDLIHRLIDDFKGLADKKYLKLSFENNIDSFTLKSNESLLKSSLRNLISNAIKYTDKGEVVITFEIINDDSIPYVKINVADTGIGISPKKEEVIWDEFRQESEGSTRNFQGMGIGLTITKKSVRLLGGDVYVRTEPGKGSIFTIELPVAHKVRIPIDESRTPTLQKTPIKVTKPDFNVRKKILHVDDDIFSQRVIKRMLEKYYDIDSASDEKRTMEKISNNEYDLIIMDVNLGTKTDGVELTQLIRKIEGYEDVPVIAVTAFAADSDKEKFLSKGMNAYLSKPFNNQVLLDLVGKTINKTQEFCNKIE